jgi:hypothetical protein
MSLGYEMRLRLCCEIRLSPIPLHQNLTGTCMRVILRKRLVVGGADM